MIKFVITLIAEYKDVRCTYVDILFFPKQCTITIHESITAMQPDSKIFPLSAKFFINAF